MNQEIFFSWVNVAIIEGKTKQEDLKVKSVKKKKIMNYFQVNYIYE
jgi:hypothetical protein